jgi:hypothetical protein
MSLTQFGVDNGPVPVVNLTRLASEADRATWQSCRTRARNQRKISSWAEGLPVDPAFNR